MRQTEASKRYFDYVMDRFGQSVVNFLIRYEAKDAQVSPSVHAARERKRNKRQQDALKKLDPQALVARYEQLYLASLSKSDRELYSLDRLILEIFRKKSALYEKKLTTTDEFKAVSFAYELLTVIAEQRSQVVRTNPPYVIDNQAKSS